jgi:Flp pilus assembly protein CpaB
MQPTSTKEEARAIYHAGTTREARSAKALRLAKLLGCHLTLALRAVSGNPEARAEILARAISAKKVEIFRGQTGNWLYDVNRHINLCLAIEEYGERTTACR